MTCFQHTMDLLITLSMISSPRSVGSSSLLVSMMFPLGATNLKFVGSTLSPITTGMILTAIFSKGLVAPTISSSSTREFLSVMTTKILSASLRSPASKNMFLAASKALSKAESPTDGTITANSAFIPAASVSFLRSTTMFTSSPYSRRPKRMLLESYLWSNDLMVSVISWNVSSLSGLVDDKANTRSSLGTFNGRSVK